MPRDLQITEISRKCCLRSAEKHCILNDSQMLVYYNYNVNGNIRLAVLCASQLRRSLGILEPLTPITRPFFCRFGFFR